MVKNELCMAIERVINMCCNMSYNPSSCKKIERAFAV